MLDNNSTTTLQLQIAQIYLVDLKISIITICILIYLFIFFSFQVSHTFDESAYDYISNNVGCSHKGESMYRLASHFRTYMRCINSKKVIGN